MICRKAKADYFSLAIWTTQITLNRLAKFVFARDEFHTLMDRRRRDRRAQTLAALPVGHAEERPTPRMAKPDNGKAAFTFAKTQVIACNGTEILKLPYSRSLDRDSASQNKLTRSGNSQARSQVWLSDTSADGSANWRRKMTKLNVFRAVAISLLMNATQANAYGIRDREVTALPRTATCMSDHGTGMHGKPLCSYGALRGHVESQPAPSPEPDMPLWVGD